MACRELDQPSGSRSTSWPRDPPTDLPAGCRIFWEVGILVGRPRAIRPRGRRRSCFHRSGSPVDEVKIRCAPVSFREPDGDRHRSGRHPDDYTDDAVRICSDEMLQHGCENKTALSSVNQLIVCSFLFTGLEFGLHAGMLLRRHENHS